MAKKKNQKRVGGNYSGNRVKKENTYGSSRRKTYMILSTAAIIIGLIMTGVQSLGTSRSNVELAYSDMTTVIREMEDEVSAFVREAEKQAHLPGTVPGLLLPHIRLSVRRNPQRRDMTLQIHLQMLSPPFMKPPTRWACPQVLIRMPLRQWIRKRTD